VHLLAALEEVPGPLSSVLKPTGERWLYERAEPLSNLGGGIGYVASQAVQAATHFAVGRQDWYALSHLEHWAAGCIADRRHLDDDQRYSLLSHHRDRVETLACEARPDLVDTPHRRRQRYPRPVPLVAIPVVAHHRRRAWRKVVPNFMVGWPTWFSNRRAGLRDKHFRLVTASAYRGQPAVRR
jgi:hypothetical protein